MFLTLRNIRLTFNHSHKQFLKFCTGSLLLKNDQFLILKEQIQSNTKGFTPEFVFSVKNEVFKAGNRINPENFDCLFMDACIQNNLFDIGKLFFLHIHERNENTSLALVRKYFRLCFNFKNLTSEADRKLLILLYEKIRKDYPALDSVSCESLSMGLSITDKWLECLNLLHMSKMYGDPTTHLYSSIIIAAFDRDDDDLGWHLMHEMMREVNNCAPTSLVYAALLKKMSDSSLQRLFKFLERYGLRLPEETATFLKENKVCNITSISVAGVCRHCRISLAPIVVTDSEFKQLTEDFLNPVLVGKDIFIKTKPSELERFIKFLDKCDKVDVVLDGLNIAFSGIKKKSLSIANSKMLMAVVKYFVKKDLNVMVLGREHMCKWPHSDMSFIRNNASIFFTEDLSSDDPYLLYATMYFGIGTKFVSRDLMRGHKYLLKTPEKKRIFYNWQQKHQLLLSYIEKNGNVHLKEYSGYLLNSQFNHGKWHVPIHEPNQPGLQPHIQALNMKWLCY